MPKGIYLSKKRKGLFQKGHKINIGRKYSEESIKKMSEARIGIKFSKDTKKKMSEARKGKLSNALGRHWKLSKKTKLKMSKAKKGKYVGKNNHFWKGGISFLPYSLNWTETLKKSIRERDNYICKKCSQYGNTVHHIDYDKKNCNLDNLITLCVSCHIKTNFNRENWERYFNKILKKYYVSS